MNTLIMVIFFALAALILISAVMVVTVKNIIHAALWLTASFLGAAALYLLMEAEFLAVVQVLIYAGAISILILFAIMLTRHVTGEGVRQLYERWWVALVVAILLFGAVLVPNLLSEQANWDSQVAAAQTAPAPPAAECPPATVAGSCEIGVAFMRDYLLPFEVASVLLLVALVGAIVIAHEERARRRRVPTLAEEVALKHSIPVERDEDIETALSPAGREGT